MSLDGCHRGRECEEEKFKLKDKHLERVFREGGKTVDAIQIGWLCFPVLYNLKRSML